MSEQNLAGQTLGPYEVGRLIGSGGCGAVYSARSTVDGPAGEAGTSLALKVFHPELVREERIFRRFQREAELGMRIRHPHIVPTFECGAAQLDGEAVHYMAMEFVEGETLRDLLQELRTVPEDLLYQIADQVLDALSAIHREGMIHRDVKPENIIITREQQVRVMDLGVARLQQEGRDLTLGGEFVGSLAYAAPEQFTDQDHVDPRADLYALGVLLYEMGTGINPYDEANLSQLIDKKIRTSVRRPRLVNRDLDAFLDEAIQTCLQISPNDRFADCGELRRVLAEKYESDWWKARISGEAFPAATRALRRLRPPREAPLVGRDAELAVLHALFEEVRAGAGAVALVSGPAGIGKSRLVHDFFEDLMAPDGPILLAGCCPEESGRAHHAFLEAARGYLGGREAGEPAEADPFTGFAAFVRGLAGQRPVVLALEDLQRADPGSIGLLENLARELADVPVLLVGTWRPEEVEDGAALHALTTELASKRSTRTLELAPLDREGVEAILGALLRVPSTVRALRWPLMRASSGNVHFLLELVDHLRTTGALVKGEAGWTAPRPIREVGLPESIRLLVIVRLVDVDASLMQLLEAASAQGPEFDASLLSAVMQQRRLRLLKRLAVLERKHRVLESAGRGQFRFVSHGLWQVVYEGMREERRRECHALCADALRGEAAELAGHAAYAWVGHMLAAGRIGEALAQVPAAVEHAATQIHAVRGILFLERLAAAVEGPALRLGVWNRLAGLHALLGQTGEERLALEAAEAAAQGLGADGPRGRLTVRLAVASMRAGNLEQAAAEAQQGAALAKACGDRAGLAEALDAQGDVALRSNDLERSADLWREAVGIRRALGDKAGEAATSLRLGLLLPRLGEGEAGLAMREAALAGYREVGDRRGEAAALNSVGHAHVDAGRTGVALECYERSLSLVRELGDLPAEAATLHNLARLHGIESRIEEALESFHTALDIFRQLHDASGEAATLDELGSVLATYGDRGPALECLEGALAVATAAGDRTVLTRVRRHLADLRHELGEIEEAWREFAEALDIAPRGERSALLADMGSAALREGDADRAAQLLAESLDCAEGATRKLVSFCRLSRAMHEAGRTAQARTYAERAESLLGEPDVVVAAHLGPELYYTLATALAGEERAADYLGRANDLLSTRTHAIRTIVYRDHYLTSCWPNREILQEVRDLSSSAGQA